MWWKIALALVILAALSYIGLALHTVNSVIRANRRPRSPDKAAQ